MCAVATIEVDAETVARDVLNVDVETEDWFEVGTSDVEATGAEFPVVPQV